MKSFINDLKNALKKRKLSDEVIQDIVQDYEGMIQAGLEDGVKEADILKKFGTVDRIAEELAGVERDTSKAPGEDVKVVKQVEVTDEAYHVDVTLPTENVSYIRAESNVIEITANRTIDDAYDIEYADGTLKIRAPKTQAFGLFNWISRRLNVSFTIALPTTPRCVQLSHKTVTGDVTFENLTLERVKLNNVNGNAKTHGVHFGEVMLQTVNGDLKVDASTVKSLHAHLVNGDIKLTNTTFDETIRVETVSGDISINTVTSGDCTTSAVSGDFCAEEFYPASFQSRTLSGDLTIKNTKPHTISKENIKTTSGTVSIN